MQASPICRIGSRPQTSLISLRVNGEPQRIGTLAFGSGFFFVTGSPAWEKEKATRR